MAVKVSGNRGLSFVGSFDISEIEDNAKRVLALIGDVQKQTAQVGGIKGDDSYRQEQLAMQKAMEQTRVAMQGLKTEQQAQRTEQEKSKAASAASRAELEKLKIAEQELTNQYKAGKVALTEYALEQRKIGDAQREAVKAQKEAERTLRQQVKLQEQQEKQAERNRKALEKESSEYYKLSTALGNVRKEAKDALAEMFRLEQAGLKGSNAYKQLEIRSKALSAQTNILDKGIKGIDASLGLHQRNVGNYGSALANLSPRFAAIDQSLSAFGTSIDQLATSPDPFKALGTSLMAFGKATITFMLTPIGAIITALAGLYALFSANKQTVIDFDAGLKGVQKTTGIAGEELEKLGSAVVSMSNELKSVSSKSLLEYAQAAGQLGVKGSANILRFAETMAKLQVASDISGEEGASAIARLLTLTDGGVENVADFGNEIVRLGNNFAATEKEILGNATRIAQNTGLYKIGRQEVLAYATATKAVGVEAELVGSTFGRTLGEFEKALRTGKNVEVLARVTGKSVEDLKSSFKTNASGVFNDFVKGLNGIDKAGGSVNGVLQQLGIDAIRDQAVLSSLATNGFKPLNDAMNDAKNAGNALGEEFETANQKLENVGKRIGIAWDNLILSFENGQGIIAKTGAALGNGLADALVSVKEGIDALGVYFKVLFQYFGDLLPAVEETTKVTTEYASVLDGLGKFLKGISLRSFLYTFTVEIPNAIRMGVAHLDTMRAGVYELLKFLSKTGPEIGKVFKSMFTPGESVDTSGLKALFEDYRDQAKNADKQILDAARRSNQAAIDLFKHRYTAAENANKIGEKLAANDSEEIQKATAEEIKAIQEAEEQKKKAREQSLAAQRALQGKIDEINTTARRKQLTSDEAEIQAVRDKYIKIRKEVDAFYKDPKNKGLKVDVSKLKESENIELDNVRYKQATDALKTELDRQKTLYAEYEKFKTTFGEAQAKARYENEVNISETYMQRLQKELKATQATGSTAMSSEQLKRREYLLKEIEAEGKRLQAISDAQYADALKATETFETKKLDIIKKYAAMEAALRDQPLTEDSTNRLREIAALKEQELDAVKDEAFQKTKIYQDLNDNLIEQTKEQIAFQIQAVQQILDNAKQLTNEQRRALEADLKGLQALMNNAAPEGRNTATSAVLQKEKALQRQLVLLKEAYTVEQLSTKEYRQQAQELAGVQEELSNITAEKFAAMSEDANGVSKELSEWAVLLAPIDEDLSYAVNTAGQLASAFGDAAMAAGQFASGDIVGGIKSAVSAIGKVLTINKQVKEMNAAARKEVADFYDAAMEGEKAYQRLLRQRELDQARRNKLTLEGINAEQKALQNQARAVGNDYQTLFNDLMQQQYVKDTKYTHGTWFRKAKTEYQMASLAGKDYNELEQLYLEGRLKDKAKEDFEALQQLKEELEAIGLSLEDLQDEYNRIWTGTTSDAITDSIVQMFEDGIPAAQELADNFEAMMKKAALNAFQFQYVEKQMQEFYKKFAEAAASDGQLTAAEIVELRQEYETRMAQLIKDFESLNAVTGMSETDTPTADAGPDQSTLSGAIRASLTEETGGKLAGILQGQFGLQKQQLMTMGDTLDVAKQSINYLMRIENNTLLNAQSSVRIEGKLDTMGSTMTTIATNTKPPMNSRDQGLG